MILSFAFLPSALQRNAKGNEILIRSSMNVVIGSFLLVPRHSLIKSNKQSKNSKQTARLEERREEKKSSRSNLFLQHLAEFQSYCSTAVRLNTPKKTIVIALVLKSEGFDLPQRSVEEKNELSTRQKKEFFHRRRRQKRQIRKGAKLARRRKGEECHHQPVSHSRPTHLFPSLSPLDK